MKIEEELKIKYHCLNEKIKEEELLSKLLDHDYKKYIENSKIRKSFLKDVLLFTDSVLNKYFPVNIKKKVNGYNSYSYYEYEKEYLNQQIKNPLLINWLKKRVLKYTQEQKIFFNLVFHSMEEEIFEKNNNQNINYNDITNKRYILKQEILDIKKEIDNVYSNHLDVKNYFNNFKYFSKHKRKFTLILGPTNSGKTHQAISKLISSKNGLYLAPLRLLALEIYQNFKEKGINCNLITGEEQILEKNAQFTSSTIEMCNFNNYYETVIIDETQLLTDKERGAAWTNAIIGVNSRNIICLGTTEIKKSLENLIFECQSNSIIENTIITKRMNKLEITSDNEIIKGTAIITFSRKNVLYFADYYKNKGFSVSVIYGALSPEVRKNQINRFIMGEADIIIATDAIGMGVNLPIKKILFSAIEKYDGLKRRLLSSHEIKQIAGRAGRFSYNQNENGLVSLTKDIYNEKLIELLKKNIETINNFSNNIYISPNFNYINKLNSLSKDNNIFNLLTLFSKINTGKENWLISDLKNQLNIAAIIESNYSKLPIKEKFELCFAPIDNEEIIKDFLNMIYNKKDYNYTEYLNIKPFSTINLDGIETIVKIIGHWVWLNNKYPNIFKIDNFDKFNEYKNNINDLLDKKLIFKAKKTQKIQ